MFKLEIKTGGAAFQAENCGVDTDRFNHLLEDDALDPYGTEVRRLLRQIEHALGDGQTEGVCMDINGNRVGEWSYE